MIEFNDHRLPTRFWAKLVLAYGTTCWIWTGSKSNGYGKFGIGSRVDDSSQLVRAHRYAYEALVGSMPAGLQLDHLCKNRACCNPAHLEVVSTAVNTRRGRVTKLTETQVAEIRAKYATGGVLQRELGLQYGVTRPQISRLINRRQWKKVKPSVATE